MLYDFIKYQKKNIKKILTCYLLQSMLYVLIKIGVIMKKRISMLFMVLTVFTVLCFAKKEEIKERPKFNYVEQQLDSISVSVAFVNPAIEEAMSFNYSNPLEVQKAGSVISQYYENKELGLIFIKSISELCKYKGVNRHNIFPSYKDMTYLDKRKADLLITCEVITNPQSYDFKRYDAYSFSKGDQWKHTWTVKMKGYINLIIYEPTTKEKLWTKQIDLPETTENATAVSPNKNLYEYILSNDEYIREAYAVSTSAIFKKYYDLAMPLISNDLNQELFRELKDVAVEIKGKK